MTDVTITERGWDAHFVCANRCRYRRNTLVTGPEGRFIVSSVGNMRANTGEIETIGCRRYYETMIFTVVEDEPYLDIGDQISDHDGPWSICAGKPADLPDDVDRPWSICAGKPADLPDDVDNVADKMHDATVAFYAKRVGEETGE